MGFKTYSIGLMGLDGFVVTAEADLSSAIPAFDIIGLPDAEVKESRDRVRAVFKACGLTFPLAKIVVNLAPADQRKTGSHYDLPIFIAVLRASGLVPPGDEDCAFLGQLSLYGELYPVPGVLPMAICAKKNGLKSVFVPAANAGEGAVIEGVSVFGAAHVSQIIAHLRGERLLPARVPSAFGREDAVFAGDFAEVRGQNSAKRALEIAASGGHNVILVGPPGSGKSMLAKRLPTILPSLSFDESIETTQLHSIAGILPGDIPLVKARPFRSPHHTISPVGLSGGGAYSRPGEISLAHNGVLFLDEFPEFSRQALEVLRQPMEDMSITIARANARFTYPCQVMVVAAMNPCPCGFFGHPSRPCTCGQGSVARYLSKISGPMLDRFDLHIDVQPVQYEHLASDKPEESSAAVRERVNRARHIQLERFAGTGLSCNARLTPALIKEFCELGQRAKDFLASAFERLGLSARAYDRIIKVSRTIADLDDSKTIELPHIAQAVQYRGLDRKYWGGPNNV